MKTSKEQVREMLENPEVHILPILDCMMRIDKRLCKTLICMLPDEKRLLHYYRIPFWYMRYNKEIAVDKLAAIFEINIKIKEKEEEKFSEYLMAEEYFRKGRYEETRYWLLKAAEKGDKRAIELIELLKRTQKNSFHI